jgi:hypothetical protein
MHLLTRFAVPLSEPGRQARRELALPQLSALLQRLRGVEQDLSDELGPTPPREGA